MGINPFKGSGSRELKKKVEAAEDEQLAVDKKGKDSKRSKKDAVMSNAEILEKYPHLVAVKPRERYVFHSDYFDVDGEVATIMGFFSREGADDMFGAFWGVNRIPSGLDDRVTTIVLEQTRRMTDSWIEEHQSRTETVTSSNSVEQSKSGTQRSRRSAGRLERDLRRITEELANGDAYLNVQTRLMVKAPNLDVLDGAISKIARLYIDRFATVLEAHPYPGEQRAELANLFKANEKKLGAGEYFTSTEYAGSYMLVTQGVSDDKGEYVGYMVGDVNNSAVLFDTDGYRHHVVVCDESRHQQDSAIARLAGAKSDAAGGIRSGDMWCSKLSQSALTNSHRVVHMIFNGANMDDLGPKFSSFTTKVDMNKGDVNMFEMFGDVEDELTIFPAHLKKLVLMAEQAYETTDSDRSVIRGSLEKVATRFYVDQRMWYENALENRKRLRLVDLPHEENPRLEEFVAYLDVEYKSLVASSARDDEMVHAMNILATTFRNLLNNNGDLFNTFTKDYVDDVKSSGRTIYDFSQLMKRGKGIAMAQFVNVLSFACQNMTRGDVIVIHGADHIDEGIRDYVTEQFDMFFDNGGRVVYSYDKFSSMLRDYDFCHLDRSDYTIFGMMSMPDALEFERRIEKEIPPDLKALITSREDGLTYIRRNFDNVVFQAELELGLRKGDEPSKEKVRKPSRKKADEERQRVRDTEREQARAHRRAMAARKATPRKGLSSRGRMSVD